MAKKRKKGKKEEEEEYEFIPPEFNEKEFLEKEIRDTRTALLTIGYAIVLGVIAGGISALGRSYVAPCILIVLVGIALLKYFYKALNIDTSQFARKNWVGNVGTLFMTFLAIWVLMINIPFLDLAKPTVDTVIVWVDDGTTVHGLEYKYVQTSGDYKWVVMDNDTWTPPIKTNSSTHVNITARVTDNGRLSRVEVGIGSTATYNQMTGYDDKRFEFEFTADQLGGQSLMFYIHAEDSAGNSVIWNPTISISAAA
jgi:hypothetical protein